jgi:hypothetical protein
METLTMSRKERERLTIMTGVKREELTLVQASDLMAVCYRQSKRIWRRYQDDGDAGLVHRLRGKPSARRKPPALRAQALALYAEERYSDFGPTLMAEQLAKEKLVVDHETLRRWRLAEGKHTVRRRRQQHRQWRERKACFGEMVQMDGSHHDWFEGRGPKCVLMVMSRPVAVFPMRLCSVSRIVRAPESSNVYDTAISAGTMTGLHADTRVTVSPACAYATAQSTAFSELGEPSTPTMI